MVQKHVIENDLHPCYRKDNFQSESCYNAWKNKKLEELRVMLIKFDHVSFDSDFLEKKEKYIQKLANFSSLYEKLVEQIFKNLKNNRAFRLTSNSKRLLKEFQLRFCIVKQNKKFSKFLKFLNLGHIRRANHRDKMFY